MRDRRPWTIWWVVVVSVSATVIGVRNLEWFLNATCIINTLPDISKHCK
jgi:hypothetical protein